MASSSRTESDAKRMGSRSFAGYVVDRATGRADFSKANTTQTESAASSLGVSKTRRPGVPEEAYAKGGLVQTPKCVPYQRKK